MTNKLMYAIYGFLAGFVLCLGFSWLSMKSIVIKSRYLVTSEGTYTVLSEDELDELRGYNAFLSKELNMAHAKNNELNDTIQQIKDASQAIYPTR